MKKSLVITAMLCSALAVFAQKSELRIVLSSDIFEPVYNDYLPDDQQLSIGLEYSKAISKRLDIETGLMYSKSGFAAIWCDFCEPAFEPYYYQTKEINGKLGIKWTFIEKESIGLYTAIGVQGNKKIAPVTPLGFPDEDHFSGAIYQDLGIRFKLSKSFSVDFELKGRYNLPDETGIYYNKSKTKLGAGIGFNYSF